MQRTVPFTLALLVCFASTIAQGGEPPKLDVVLGIPEDSAMVCQFDRQTTETKSGKTQAQVDYFAVISSKSAQLCNGEGKADHEKMSCKRFEFVGKNEGNSIIFVSDDGYKLTTNMLALAVGAGVSIKDLKMTVSTAYTGTCRKGDIAVIKKGMAGYEE